MSKALKGIVTVLIGICLCAGKGAAGGAQDTVVVRILHSNDLYGQLPRQGEDGDLRGGMAPRVHLIREIQAEGPTLVLDAGDAIGPAVLSAWVEDRGTTMVAAMRLAGYAAMAPGNYEFGYGLEVLGERRKEAEFPFLAANLQGKGGMELPVEGYLLKEVEGVKIGILGVISTEIATQTNPKHVADLTFTDPLKAARRAAGALQEQGADYVIGLVHMREPEALALAQQVAGIDLVVAGGYKGLERAAQVPALVRLVNGAQLVTTPRYGSHLGRVDVTFLGTEGGGYRVEETDAVLIPVTAETEEDPEVAGWIETLKAEYAKATGEVLGGIEGKTLEAQAEAVANLMRSHTEMEVGIVNRGTFREIAAGDSLHLRDIDRFIRFDDVLVKVALTGQQLRNIVKQSQRAQGGAGLVFAGLDPKGMTVNGRPIQGDEPYWVVTVEFLAEGGDGYREFGKGASALRTGISLRSLLVAWLKAGRLSSKLFRELDRRQVWRSGWSVEGTFRRNYVNGTTEDYQRENERVSFLKGETSIAWSSATRYFLNYESGAHAVLFENTTDFGQVRGSDGDLETSSDRLDADATYRYRLQKLGVDPLVSSGISTAFVRSGGQRPFLFRSSVGFQRRAGRLVMKFAGRGQRDYVANKNDFGAEVTLTYQRRLQQGGRFRSKSTGFLGLTDRKVISLENYNTFSFPLAGALSLIVRQNNFIYRVDKIGDAPAPSGLAFRTDLKVGFAYGLDWKWF